MTCALLIATPSIVFALVSQPLHGNMRRLIKPRHKVCNAWNEMPVDHQGRIPSDSPADWHTASSSISRRDHRLKSLLKLLMFATARLTHGLLLSTALKTDLQ